MRILILYICFFINGTAISQNNNIAFAGTNINLGMSKTEVLNRIDPNFYKIEDQPNILIVYTKKNDELIGSLNFNQSQKIIYIFKNWGTFLDAKEAFKILFSLLKKSNKTSLFNEIKLSEFVEPDIQTKGIEIILDDRRISLSYIEQNFSIQISEAFE